MTIAESLCDVTSFEISASLVMRSIVIVRGRIVSGRTLRQLRDGAQCPPGLRCDQNSGCVECFDDAHCEGALSATCSSNVCD